jgi:hypothetical protein
MTEDIRTYQRLVAEQSREIERLRQRLGPRGLEVVIIDGYGHYTNAAVKAEIERLRGVLRKIYEQYDNQDMSHADFRVHAARLASPVISEPKSAALLSEIDESFSDMRDALAEIAAAHLPDQPAESGVDERVWALQHIARLRGIARAALPVVDSSTGEEKPK